MNHTYKPALGNIGIQFFAMKNLDAIRQERTELLSRMSRAVQDNNAEAFQQAFGDLADAIQDNIRGEFLEAQAQQDNSILAARGCRVLTSQEQKYYKDILDALKSENPKQALTGINTVLPDTVIDAVFQDLRDNHPLLNAINFQPTGALVKILMSTTGGAAKWGAIDKSFTGELSANFLEIDLSMATLTAFIPVNRYMLDLGPAWLDRYVRELLSEALAVELEVGIVAGNGKEQPIGMMKKLTGAVDGVYGDKTPISINDLSPATIGGIMNILTVGTNGKRRSVTNLLMVVNPADYFTKIFPATTPRAADGTYNHDVMPYPTSIVQSSAVPAGKAVFGIGSKYFMGLGTQSGGKIEYSDEYKFLERQRMYAIFLYGYGRAMDENAFVLADISGMKEYAMPVVVMDAEEVRLSSLAIGSLELTPAFDKNVTNYTASTSNATNTITAVAKDGEAAIEVKNGSTPVNNGSAATWSAGENMVTVKVTNGGSTKTYTVTVTKS